MTFKRRCRKCDKIFQPLGKFEKMCQKCRKEVKNVNFIKLIAFRNGIDLNTIKKNW